MGDLKQNIINGLAAISVALAHPNVVMSYATRRIQLKNLFGLQHAQGQTTLKPGFVMICVLKERMSAV